MAHDTDTAWLSQLGLLIKPAGPDCNLACTYCFYSGKGALYPETRQHAMSAAVARKLVADYMDVAGPSPSFGWQGGEPTVLGVDFLRRIVALQAQTARPGTAIANGLQTNGMLMDDEWARFLRRYRFLVGLSLDGPREVHDHYRRDHAGEPTFDRVMRAAQTLRANQVEFNVLCMVTDHSASRGAEIMSFMLEQDLTFLQFIPCLERDPATGHVLPYTCSPAGYGRFLCDTFDVWAQDWPPKAYVRTFDDLLAAAAGRPAPACVFRPACGDYLLVEHNGDVYPCDFFVEREHWLGNIMQTSLRDIALSDAFQAFRHQKQPYDATCLACEWLAFCHGACPRHRPGVGPAAPANYFCESYRMLFGHAMERLQGMARRLAEEGDGPTT